MLSRHKVPPTTSNTQHTQTREKKMVDNGGREGVHQRSGVVVHACNTGNSEVRKKDHEFKASFSYIVRLRPAWATCDGITKEEGVRLEA